MIRSVSDIRAHSSPPSVILNRVQDCDEVHARDGSDPVFSRAVAFIPPCKAVLISGNKHPEL